MYPMYRTIVLALAAAVLSLVSCASPQPVTSTLQLERVVVAPINLSVRLEEPLQRHVEPVWQELISFMRSQNQTISVLDRDDAAVVWEEVLNEMDESGTPRELGDAMARFARRLAAESSYDVLVMPSLVVRRARVDGVHASWDGVRRPLSLSTRPDLGTAELGGYAISNRGFSGGINASSVHIAILNSRGESVFDGLGGLALLEQADRNRVRMGRPWTLAMRERPFDVPEQLREGIALAFSRPLSGLASAR